MKTKEEISALADEIIEDRKKQVLSKEKQTLSQATSQWLADKKVNPREGKALNVKSDNESSNNNLTGKKL